MSLELNYISIELVEDDRRKRGRVRTLQILPLEIQKRIVEHFERNPTKTRYGWVRHGGDVPNSYGYPAYTDTMLVLSVRQGNSLKIKVWGGHISANKVTLGGAANNCLDGARALFDYRFSKQSKKDTWDWIEKEVFGE